MAPGRPRGHLSPEDVQSIIGRSAFIRFLDLRVVSLDAERDEIVLKMPMRPELERGAGSGQFHGGPLAAFIDIVGD